MSITIHCPFHNQHNLNNFPLDSLLPKPPNATVHSLLFPSPKFHCPFPKLSLSPNIITHPTTPPPCHNLTIHCPLPNLHQFHHQLTNLFQMPIIQLSNPKTLPFPIIQLSTLYLSLSSSHCPLPNLTPIIPLSTPLPPSHHPTVHSLTSPSHHPTVHSLTSLPSSHCPLPNLTPIIPLSTP